MDGIHPHDEDDGMVEVMSPRRELDLEIRFTC